MSASLRSAAFQYAPAFSFRFQHASACGLAFSISAFPRVYKLKAVEDGVLKGAKRRAD
jgi:hypothetical protein